jgi:hypothetical protein
VLGAKERKFPTPQPPVPSPQALIGYRERRRREPQRLQKLLPEGLAPVPGHLPFFPHLPPTTHSLANSTLPV